MDVYYAFDGSFEGLLSAVFLCYRKKERPVLVTEHPFTPSIFSTVRKVKTESERAERVDKKLKTLLSRYNYLRLRRAFKSGEPDKSAVCFNYILKIIDGGQDLSYNYADGDIYKLKVIADRVSTEIHRFKGFVRFEKTVSGIYCAKIAPDNDIAAELLPHFAARYKNMPFIICDVKREVYACHNDNDNAVFYQKPERLDEILASNDRIPLLWKKYYDSVNIPDRLNEKLMKGYMPRRYHVYLPEKDPLLGIVPKSNRF